MKAEPLVVHEMVPVASAPRIVAQEAGNKESTTKSVEIEKDVFDV